ncbi:MAG: 30S ribosomal protein S16 [Salinibacter sp.]
MSVKLRLRRLGRKKIPVFSIVAADSRNARDGRYIEDIGRYYPLRDPAEVRLDEERALYWLDNGAQPSDTVRSILYRRGLMLQNHLIQKGTSPDEIEEKVAAFRERMAQKGEDIKMAVQPRGEDALEKERERAEDLDEEAKLRAQATPLSVVQEEEETDAGAPDAEAEEPADDTAQDDTTPEAEEAAAETDAADAEAEADPEADTDADAEADTDADADASDDEASEEDETSDE